MKVVGFGVVCRGTVGLCLREIERERLEYSFYAFIVNARVYMMLHLMGSINDHRDM